MRPTYLNFFDECSDKKCVDYHRIEINRHIKRLQFYQQFSVREIKHFIPKYIHLNVIPILIIIYVHLFAEAIYLTE